MACILICATVPFIMLSKNYACIDQSPQVMCIVAEKYLLLLRNQICLIILLSFGNLAKVLKIADPSLKRDESEQNTYMRETTIVMP